MRFLLGLVLIGANIMSGQTLDVALKSVTVQHVFAGQKPPRWERGRLLGIDSDSATVFAFDSQGQAVMNSRVSPQRRCESYFPTFRSLLREPTRWPPRLSAAAERRLPSSRG